jgi:predicted RNA-binding protein with RPS1 domain
LARIHKTQLPFDPETNISKFEEYKVDDKIKGKILSIQKSSSLFIDLTLLEQHLALPEGVLDESKVLPSGVELINSSEKADKLIGKVFPGVIKSIAKDSIHPFYIELSNDNFGYLNVFEDIIPINHCDRLNNIEDHYIVGKVYEFYVKTIKKKKQSTQKELVSFELCFSGREVYNLSHEIGSLCVAKVLKPSKNYLRLQIGAETFASCDILEITDEWVADPLQTLALNQYVKARIISIDEGKNQINVSLRDSFTNEKNWKVLSGSGTTLQYKKLFSELEGNGDLRARLYKLGAESLKVGMLFVGKINK